MAFDPQTDPDFLAHEAYGDTSDLRLRIQIQERHRTNPQNWFEWLFAALNIPPNSRILELGCGPGDLWLQNRPRLPVGWQVTLSDLSLAMSKTARDALGDSERFLPTVFDVQAIPFPAAHFAAALGIGLLDHVPDPGRALAEITRVLQPGGRFYASAGGQTHLQEIAALVRPFLPTADYGGDPGRFGLENGARILAPYFGEVRLERYPDRLVFDQPGPLIAYVLSEPAVRAGLVGEQRAAFVQFVQNELAVRGRLQVTTDKGLFIAQ